jgi:hypothetical protein
VHLCGARPGDVTGQTLHTYTYGETWGTIPETPPQWSPELLRILGRDNLSASDPSTKPMLAGGD